jgi:Domain of unknown function (DUF1788)
MSSLDSTFDSLRGQLKRPDALNPAKSDPLFYFVHAPSDTLEIRTRLPRWTAMLREDGREVDVVSLSALFWELIDASGRWDDWLEIEPDYEPAEINEAVSDVLRGGLVEAVAARVAARSADRVVFLLDAGLLHPYFRVRPIESALHDRVKTPTVLFYPGRRSGLYGLHFLGFYSEDGNYRSTLIGEPA